MRFHVEARGDASRAEGMEPNAGADEAAASEELHVEEPWVRGRPSYCGCSQSQAATRNA